jgi:Sigma-70, region 4
MTGRKPNPKEQAAVDAELAALVQRAQDGDAAARDELFTRFENFLKKYKGFFRSEADAIRLARQYSDVAAFLGLFMGKKTFHAVQSRRWSPTLTAQVTRKVNEIRELAREIGDQDDIDTIIDMTFIELIARYDSKGKVRKELKKKGINYDTLSRSQQRRHEADIPPVGFEGYLMNVFKWRLFKNIENETKGVIPGVGWCKAYATTTQNHDGDETEVNLAEVLAEDTADAFEILGSMEHLDHDWVSGETCYAPFDVLSSQERWILKAKYADHLSSREIAESIGVSPSVIRSRYNEILDKIRPSVGEVRRYNVKDSEGVVHEYSHIEMKE